MDVKSLSDPSPTTLQQTDAANDGPRLESGPPERLLEKPGYFSHPILYAPFTPSVIRTNNRAPGRFMTCLWASPYLLFTFACLQYCDAILCLDLRDGTLLLICLLSLILIVRTSDRVEYHNQAIASWEKQREERR